MVVSDRILPWALLILYVSCAKYWQNSHKYGPTAQKYRFLCYFYFHKSLFCD